MNVNRVQRPVTTTNEEKSQMKKKLRGKPTNEEKAPTNEEIFC